MRLRPLGRDPGGPGRSCPARGGEARAAAAAEAKAKAYADQSPGLQVEGLGSAAGAALLTPREREIANLAARGRTSKEVAADLVLSVRTVDNHLANVYAKLGIPGRAELGGALAPRRARGARRTPTPDRQAGMTPEEIELVTRSAERVAPRLPELSADFYGRLFAAHPEVRPLFPADNTGQEAKFAASLAAIVEAIPDFVAFSDRTAALGRVHAAHRIGAAQYGVVGAVLLETLGESDPQWDGPTAAAWATAYDLLAESMMLAARTRA